MKKNIIINGLLAAALLAGCGQKPHVHKAQGGWVWNGTDHWHICDCGETMDTAPHKVGDDMICTACGVEVWALDDGCVDAYSYDEQGNPLRSASFDPQGNVISELVYEYEYDENGNMLLSRSYADGVLQSEDTYTVGSDGTSMINQSLMYNEGECTLNEYDADGNIIYVKVVDGDNKVTFESWSDYAVTEDGQFYETKCTEIHEDGEKIVAEYNEHEDILRREWYDPAGNLTQVDTWEYAYDEDGQELWHQAYTDGVLVYEISSYGEVVGEDYTMRYPQTVIEYEADGSYTIIMYDENNEVLSQVHYDFEGNVID